MLAKATYPPKRPARVQYAAWLAATLLVMMAVAQLFEYENFPAVLSAVLTINDQSLIFIAAAKVVILEILALPYLLGMKLSRLMRGLSGFCAGLMGLFWFFTALTTAHVSNVGLLGSTVSFPGGILAAVWSLLLLGSLIYVVSWDVRKLRSTS